jgi:hypothetical protein
MNFINFLFGNKNNIVNKVNFEDVQYAIKNNIKNTILINTLKQDLQKCLIKNTICAEKEEHIIRKLFDEKQFSYTIIIYGKNSNDNSIYEKYQQLCDLGFINIYVYTGGLFEWLCLQDIYGKDEFSTNSMELDILKYKPKSVLTNFLLTLD